MPIRRKLLVSLCVLCALCGSALAALAQDELVLAVSRNVGYSSGSQIRGSFTLAVSGVENLASVAFKIDEAVVGAVTTPPFKIKFNTTDYPLGWHNLTAVGQTSDGRTLVSSVRRFEFATTEEEWATVQKIVPAIAGVVGVMVAVMLAVQFAPALMGKKKAALPLGAPRKYGIMGGAICPKCGRPFSMHWSSFNVGFRKLDRCDHCGKWSLVRAVSREKLAEAEAAELKMAQPETPIPQISPEEKLKQQLDASRFFDER